MKIEVDRKNANSANYAYLVDRVDVNAGKPQVYGTQMSRQTDAKGYLIPKTMIDSENVDVRRKQIGLEPMEDYLKLMKDLSSQKQ